MSVRFHKRSSQAGSVNGESADGPLVSPQCPVGLDAQIRRLIREYIGTQKCDACERDFGNLYTSY